MTRTTLIENGTIIDGTGAEPYQGNVLVRDGKVVQAGPSAVPAEAAGRDVRRIDATGQTVMPGLIDAHCHLAFDDAGSNAEIFHQRRDALSALVAAHNAKKLIRAGVTGFLDPDSTFENMIDLRNAIEAGIVEGPRMACGAYALITGVGGTAGRLIADEGVTGYYKVVNNKDEIVQEVRRQVKVGADWIKVHVTGIVPRQAHKGEMCVWSEDELKLLCETAHDLDTPVMGHCRGAAWITPRKPMTMLSSIAASTISMIMEVVRIVPSKASRSISTESVPRIAAIPRASTAPIEAASVGVAMPA